MVAPARALVSEEEFLCLPETVSPMELVDGEVIMAPAPTAWHRELLLRLTIQLREWAASQTPAPTVLTAPLDIRIAPQRIVQPDAMLYLAPLDLRQDGPIDRVPDLCIEILSTNRSYDRVTKRYLYAEAGVREYWMVDPAGLIERRHGAGLGITDELGDRLVSPLLPGLSLDVTKLFN